MYTSVLILGRIGSIMKPPAYTAVNANKDDCEPCEALAPSLARQPLHLAELASQTSWPLGCRHLELLEIRIIYIQAGK